MEKIERRYNANQNGHTQPMPATRVFDDIKKDMGKIVFDLLATQELENETRVYENYQKGLRKNF